MNNNNKNIIRDLNDNILYARINCSNEEYKKILKEITTSHGDLKAELNEIINIYESYYKKYQALVKRSKATKKIKKHIKNHLNGKKIFGYGFFSERNNRPLYIGNTYKGLERISQHLDGYSSVDRKYPLYWIDYIIIWYDDQISKHIKNLLKLRENTANTKDKTKFEAEIDDYMSRFESFIYHKFKPIFNSPIKKKTITPKNQQIFKDACKKGKEIIVSLKNENFKKVLKDLSL